MCVVSQKHYTLVDFVFHLCSLFFNMEMFLYGLQPTVVQELPSVKKEYRTIVDAVLMKSVGGVPNLKSYSAARFTLNSGMKPHVLVF